jgi:bifunctional oligoribonuclease and PAP phosphatase NrnA
MNVFLMYLVPIEVNFLDMRLYKKLELIEDGKVALIFLDNHELEMFNVKTGDTEGLVNMGLCIIGVVMSVLIIDRTERVK